MTHLICVDSAVYQFPSGGGVGPFSLRVAGGELVVLAGATGSGKSTVVRMIAGLVQRHGHGRMTGSVTVCGRDPGALSGGERVRVLGFVGQEVDDCILAGTCAGEVAFALESAGLPADRVGPALARVGLAGFEDRDPREISGGERQRLILAAALAAEPSVLLLDEPLSQLDPEGARAVVRVLRAVADEGVAVVLVEHRLGLLACADRVVTMGGRPPDRAVFHVERPAPAPAGDPVVHAARPLLDLRQVTFLYDGARGVHGVDFLVREGERVAIVGGNGAGKSTLIGLLSERFSPMLGAILRVGSVIEVPQNADLVLFSRTVAAELAYAPEEWGAAADPTILADFGLAGLGTRAPQALSRGQRLRLAVASTVAASPDVLVLDEAGSGQDPASLAGLFEAIRRRSTTTVFSSHDPELVAAIATRVVWLDGGRVVDDQPVAASRWLGLAGQVRVAPAAALLPLPLPTSPPPSTAARVGPEHRGLDARLRILLVGILGVLVVLFEGVVPLSGLACGCLVAALAHPRAVGWRRGLVVASALLAWSTALSQGLFWAAWPRTPVVQLGGLTLWKEGALHGLAQSTRFIALGAGGLLLALSTPSDELITALRARVGRFSLPFALVIMVAAMVRFVPVVAVEWAQVRRARRARGRPIWRRSPSAWLAVEVALLRPVVARCVRRARMLAESLDTRGFDPASPRGIARPLIWRTSDSVLLLGALAGLVGVSGCRVLYGLYTADVWYHSRLRPLYAFVRAAF